MILVGHIGHAHGIRGLVKLQSYTSPPTAIAGYERLMLEDGSIIALAITTMGDSLVARIDGVNDRTRAETLRNASLYIDRAQMPTPQPGEYYHADLVGLAVTDADGAALGTVTALHNFGAGDIIEIKPDGKAPFMLPFSKSFVPVVDIANRTLTIASYSETE